MSIVLATRRAALDDSAKERIRKRVREMLDGRGGGAEEDDGDGIVYLFDEPASREARVASSLVAIDFATKNEMDSYLDAHPDADRSMHKVVKTKKEPGKKEDETGKNRGPAEDEEPKGKGKKEELVEKVKQKVQEKVQDKSKEKEPEKKEPEQKPAKQKPGQEKEPEKKDAPKDVTHHPSKMPEGAERAVAIKDELAQEFGKDAAEWRTHGLDPRQLTRNVTIKFPDGSSKKWSECTDDDKKRVEKAMKDGLAASKGLNDYTQASTSAMKRNMANNLSHYDDEGVEEKKSESTEPVAKEKASAVANTVRENSKNLVRKYSKAFSSVSRPMAEKYADDVADAVREAVADGSLEGVSEADLDEFVREDMKRLVHQEVETRGRSLGDHGARHVAGNVRSTVGILGELKNGGTKVTGKQKLMAIAAQSNHDMGYTVGAAGVDISKGGEHVAQSKKLAEDEKDRYAKIFGKEGAEKIIEVIGSHDSFDTDWEREPVASAVRLADNTALFGNDKVQDLFIRSPKTVGLACKLRMAAEMIPAKPSEPKADKFEKPEDYDAAKKRYDADRKAYDDNMARPETQKQVEQSKKIQEDVKKQMHEAIDSEGFDEFDADQLHHQLDEMSEGKFSTSVDILSRYSGKLKGFKYDGEAKVVDVDMAYSPEGQTMDMLFGDSVSAKQFEKFAKDGKARPIKGKQGSTVFSNKEGKPVIRMNIAGIDKDPVQSATTAPMRDFLKHTARHELRMVSNILDKIMAGGKEKVSEKDRNGVEKVMGRLKEKCTAKEWKALEEELGELTKGPTLAEEVESRQGAVGRLTSWPLLRSERDYMKKKTAAALARMAMNVMASFVGDRIAEGLLAARGLQLKRKNVDTMSDTGGGSKGGPKGSPDFKPPREENAKPFRTRNKTDENKDGDVDKDQDKTKDQDLKTAAFDDRSRAAKASRELARWPSRLADAVKRAMA